MNKEIANNIANILASNRINETVHNIANMRANNMTNETADNIDISTSNINDEIANNTTDNFS